MMSKYDLIKHALLEYQKQGLNQGDITKFRAAIANNKLIKHHSQQLVLHLEHVATATPNKRASLKLKQRIAKTVKPKAILNLQLRRQGRGKVTMTAKQNKGTVSSESKQTLPVLDIQLRVANIQAEQPFSEQVEVPKELADAFIISHIEGLSALEGLTFDEQALVINGCVSQSGDFELIIYGLLLLECGNRQKIQAKLKVTVIPDPRSLWKNLASDSKARFHKPDSDSLSIAGEKLNLLAASIRGRSHAHKGIHRDDDIALSANTHSQWHVLAAADGAGSCKWSRKGAQLAASISTQSLQQSLDSGLGQELVNTYQGYLAGDEEQTYHKIQHLFQQSVVKAVYDAVKAIDTLVKENTDDRFKDYSTTLLLAAVLPVEDGYIVISFWVGDGAAVIYQKEANLILLGQPDGGEYAGQTRFLSPSLFDEGEIYSRIQINKIEQLSAIILATDGISDAKFETEKQLGLVPCWDVLWAELSPLLAKSDLAESEQALLAWMDFWSAGEHDDRSLALCWPAGAES